jgi:phage baseplate assembly protein W
VVPGSGRFLDLPVDVGPTGALRTTGGEDHLRDLVLQVLFTDPGERVNRPDFGCGVRRLAFSAGNDVLRATARFLISQNLERWLGDRLTVEQVDVQVEPGEEEVLRITVVYVVRQTGARQRLAVATSGGGAVVDLERPGR